MSSITIFCSDCNPGILAGESILFNKRDVSQIFTWPMAYIPTITENNKHTDFNEMLVYVKRENITQINLISHTPCEYLRYIHFMNIKEREIIDNSVENLLLVNMNNLQAHLIKLGFEQRDIDIRLFILDHKFGHLKRIDNRNLEQLKCKITLSDSLNKLTNIQAS